MIPIVVAQDVVPEGDETDVDQSVQGGKGDPCSGQWTVIWTVRTDY